MISYYYQNKQNSSIQEIDKVKNGAWVNIISTSVDEVEKYAEDLNLNSSLLKDGIDLYESPRIERDNGTIYIFVRYNEPSGVETSTQPLLIISNKDIVATVSRKPVAEIEKLLVLSNVTTTNKLKLILKILNKINISYRNHLNTVTKQIFTTRSRLAKTVISNDDLLNFIDTEEDLNEFLAALQPYGIVLKGLAGGRYFALHEDDKDFLEDIQLSTTELIDLSKSRLKTIQNIREAYTTIATNNLNKIFKRLTSITIFLMIPTIISGLYGMNVKLPGSGQSWTFMFILALSLALISLTIYTFKKKKWL